MQSKFKIFLMSIAIPLVTGLLAGLITQNSQDLFHTINKPSFAPPVYLFPIVWTILYLLMGIASYLVLSKDTDERLMNQALFFYALQLGFNFFWPIIFFRLQWYLLSLIWLILLWILILITIYYFSKVSKPAAYLMIPYLLWVTFAGILTASVYLMNKG